MSKWWYVFFASAGLYWLSVAMDIQSTWAALRSNTVHHRESNLRYMTDDGKGIDTKKFLLHTGLIWGGTVAAIVILDQTLYGGHPYVIPYASPLIGSLAFAASTVQHFVAAKGNRALARMGNGLRK